MSHSLSCLRAMPLLRLKAKRTVIVDYVLLLFKINLYINQRDLFQHSAISLKLPHGPQAKKDCYGSIYWYEVQFQQMRTYAHRP